MVTRKLTLCQFLGRGGFGRGEDEVPHDGRRPASLRALTAMADRARLRTVTDSGPAHPPGTKRDRTRNGLLAAAQHLLMERSAGSLSIRDISRAAGVSHGTFYNYFESVEALLDNLALLFAFTHASRLDALTRDRAAADEVFAVSTRQTLRFMAEAPVYARFVFDAGLRVDHFVTGMRAHLGADLRRGLREGVFAIDDVDLTVSIVTGSLLGVSLGLHRGHLHASQIEPATERLLVLLGTAPERAAALVALDVPFQSAPQVPLEWPL